MRSRLLSFGMAATAVVVPFAFAACSSSSATFDMGDDASSSSSSSSSSGGSTSSSSSSGSAPHDGGSSGTSSSGSGRVPSNITYNDAGIPLCGTDACDLKANQCCLSATLQTMCLAQSGTCPLTNASFKCAQETDCAQGQVCCATADTSNPVNASAGSQCEALTNGACTPANTASTGSAQLCQTDAECKNGMQCIWQDCVVMGPTSAQNQNVSLTMCGLQNSGVLDCTAH